MPTVSGRDASTSEIRKITPLNNIAKGAQAVLFISAAVQLVLGAFIWTGEADQLVPIHELIGLVLVLSLWTIAAVAARSGVSIPLVASAVGWSLIAPIVGWTQEGLLEGDWHWAIQVVHVLIGIGVVVFGQILIVSMRRRQRPV